MGRIALWLAAVVGVLHGLFSLYWALGGRWLLDTVGAWAVDLADDAPVAAGLVLAKTFEGARSFLIGGGVIYLALFVYGTIFGHDEGVANFVPVNWADNILHLALGGGMIVLGVVLGKEVAARRDTAAPAV